MLHVAYLILVLAQSLSPRAAASDRPVITLRRTACFGSCPVYKVTIYGDGSVVYEGQAYVRVKGTQQTKIDPGAVNTLVQEFLDADYFSLDGQYKTLRNTDGTETYVTDFPTTYTSITLDGRHKEIEDYVGAPTRLKELERKIDDASGSKHWVAIDAQGIHEEVKRGWNPNGSDGQRQLLRAVERGDADVVQAFISEGADVKAVMVNITLLQAARTPEVVKLLIAAGANVNAVTEEFGRTALMLAAYAGSVETVQVLIDAGAEVKAKGPQGETALTCAQEGLKGQESLAKFPQPFSEPLPEYRTKYQQIIDHLAAAGAKE